MPLTYRAAENLWTSAQVAAALRVGVSSVKRWTDEGKLPSVRTPGGHRRYELSTVRQFAHEHGYGTDALPEADRLTLPEDVAAVRDALLAALERGDAGTASAIISAGDEQRGIAALLDTVVGETLRRIGELWDVGEWGVEAEHQASHILAEAVDGLRDVRPTDTSPMALLASPPGEQHDLPLRMVRVVLERNGWITRYLGGNTPWQAAEAAVLRVKPSLIAMSARSIEPFESERFRGLCRTWRASTIEVAIGGEWARGGTAHDEGALRFRTLQGFEKWLRRTPRITVP